MRWCSGLHCWGRAKERPIGFFVWSLHVFPVRAWVSSGCSGVLPQPKDAEVHIRLTSYPKLPIGVNKVGLDTIGMQVRMVVCLCFSPEIDHKSCLKPEGISSSLFRDPHGEAV